MSSNNVYTPSAALLSALETSFSGALDIKHAGSDLVKMREDRGRKPVARHLALFMSEGGAEVGRFDKDGLPNTAKAQAKARNAFLMKILREKHNATKGSMEYDALEYVRENQSRFFSRLARSSEIEQTVLLEAWSKGDVTGDFAPEHGSKGRDNDKGKADAQAEPDSVSIKQFRAMSAAQQVELLSRYVNVAHSEALRTLYATLAERLTNAPAVAA